MQQIAFYQSLWAMELRQAGTDERPLEETIAMIADAGYRGVGLDLAMTDVPLAEAARPLLERHGLACLFNGFPRSDDELRIMLAMAKDFGSPFLNVIGQIMPRTLGEMIDVAKRWIDIADVAGLPLVFETHRHGLLNDLFPTLSMLDAVDDLALCADLSHFVVDREFPAEPDADSQRMITEVLDRSVAFQGRISSNEQIQLPIGFPQHQAWVERFFAWWDQGLRAWRARAPADATVTFLCELGPPPYAITGRMAWNSPTVGAKRWRSENAWPRSGAPWKKQTGSIRWSCRTPRWRRPTPRASCRGSRRGRGGGAWPWRSGPWRYPARRAPRSRCGPPEPGRPGRSASRRPRAHPQSGG